MQSRSPEFSIPNPEPTESGFSETRAARTLEGRQQDNSQVKKRKPSSVVDPLKSQMSRKDKILLVYKQNSGKIIKLVHSLDELNGQNIRLEEGILEEIKMRRQMQEELLNALLLEQKGQLSQEAISKEAWDLIK